MFTADSYVDITTLINNMNYINHDMRYKNLNCYIVDI